MVTRRTLLQQAGCAGLGLALAELPAFGLPPEWLLGQEDLVPFTDVPENFATVNPNNKRVSGLDLRQLSSYITPEQNYFVVAHYGVPQIDAATWRLDIRKPRDAEDRHGGRSPARDDAERDQDHAAGQGRDRLGCVAQIRAQGSCGHARQRSGEDEPRGAHVSRRSRGPAGPPAARG